MRLVAIALLAQLSGTGAQPAERLASAEVLSWNLQGADRAADDRPREVKERLSELDPDFLALQECSDCRAMLPAGHSLVGDGKAGVALSYDATAWQLRGQGTLILAMDDDGWGQRLARWGQFVARDGGHRLLVYSTHWCVPVRSANDACTGERHLAYARVMAAHARLLGGRNVVIAGDLNVFGGFARAPAVRYLTAPSTGFAIAEPGSEQVTFSGNHFAPPGRIDFVLARGGPIRARTPLAIEPQLSDHAPVVAEFAIR